MRKNSIKLAAVPVALALVAGACGSDSEDSGSGDAETETETTEAMEESDDGAMDFEGAEITITGSERDDPSVAAINESLKAFGDRVNLNITFAGDADWEANINTQIEGGNPPDISFFPQPGKLADFARDGSVIALTDAVNTAVDDSWINDYQLNGNVDGTQFGVPVKTDLKSLVWYKPAAFADAGYAVPTTFDEFTALIDDIAAADGPAALCVGIESGQATGWTYTDWVEEMVLRQHGGDVYDQWVANEIGFSSPEIQESMQTVVDLWADDNVFAAGGSIAATAFGDNAQPLVDGDCFMHRQASFFAGFFPEGTEFSNPDNPDAIDVFYFPDINGDAPALTAGAYAAAFNDSEATMAVMAYLATGEYAELRQKIQTEELDGGLSGFLSAAQGQDPSVYQPLEQGFLEILNNAQLARFDGSDLMPADVGAGSFWSEGTSLVNGDIDVATAGANIDATWPS